MIAYLNGRYLPLEQACVPVLDRGFLFGDGVYEVIPAYGGRLFRLPQHLARLSRSLEAVRIPGPMAEGAWTALLEELVSRNGGGDLWVYLQVTRGAAQRDHAFPAEAVPTVFAMAGPLKPPAAEVLEQGAAAVTRPDFRWGRCDIKAVTLLANVLMRQEAKEAGALEAILLRDGLALEGASSNLFVVENGLLSTPPKGPQILPGITRDLVLELARDDGLPVAEEAVPEARLRTAEEILLTSSTREIVAVTRLDGAPVGAGRPGPVYRRLRELFQAYKHAQAA